MNIDKNDFEKIISEMRMSDVTKKIAYDIFFSTKSRKEISEENNISMGRFSYIKSSILKNYNDSNSRKGYITIQATLPADQAYIVKKWAIEYKEIKKY